MSASSDHVIVVGGGVIGAACAYYLVESGRRVSIVDRGVFGGGSSGGNCGYVCPSHVLPLAEPGAVARTIQAMLAPDSPFSIKPRIDPGLWIWLLKFASRCNRRDMLAAGRGVQPLLESSLELYRELIAREALDCEWRTEGLLYVYKDKHAMEEYAATDRLLTEEFHLPARRMDGDEAVAFEPALKRGLAGGWYYENDGHLRPDKLMASLRKKLESRGTTVIENAEVTGFRRRGERATAVVTKTGDYEGDCFVVAAGAWTPFLGEELGCRPPIQPGKGYSLTMRRPERCPARPLIFPETRVAVTPFDSGYRLGSTMEFAGYDESIKQSRLELLKRGAEPYLVEPYRKPIDEEWYGWRPMTYDGLPIIDRAPALDENVWIAAGHNMLGISMAPATGRLIAELIAGVKPFIDTAPYRATRFI